MRLLFFKLNQAKTRRKFFKGGFPQKPKTLFVEGPKWYFLKFKFQICISAFVLCWKLHANFHTKNINNWAPGVFWKWKLWRACVRRNFGIGLLQSYLTFFGYLTCSVRSKTFSTLHPTVWVGRCCALGFSELQTPQRSVSLS